MVKNEKIYEDNEEEFELRVNSRNELRKRAVEKFLSEKGGYWKDGIKHVTRYKYVVEKIKDGRHVYLVKPTHLNKGIDFQVWVERMRGDINKRPRHDDIFEDLQHKKEENPQDFPKLMEAIDRVWKCEEPDKVLNEIKVDFKKGFPVELLLKMLKWLFIEQDITYWNYDGRGMLKLTIEEKVK